MSGGGVALIRLTPSLGETRQWFFSAKDLDQEPLNLKIKEH